MTFNPALDPATTSLSGQAAAPSSPSSLPPADGAAERREQMTRKIWIVVDRYYTTQVEAAAACNALNEQGYNVTIEENEMDDGQDEWAGRLELAEQRNALIDWQG